MFSSYPIKLEHEFLLLFFPQELRVDCYAQSLVAQGKSPASVDAVTTPEKVIPPLFDAYLDENDDDVLHNEINMTD